MRQRARASVTIEAHAGKEAICPARCRPNSGTRITAILNGFGRQAVAPASRHAHLAARARSYPQSIRCAQKSVEPESCVPLRHSSWRRVRSIWIAVKEDVERFQGSLSNCLEPRSSASTQLPMFAIRLRREASTVHMPIFECSRRVPTLSTSTHRYSRLPRTSSANPAVCRRSLRSASIRGTAPARPPCGSRRPV